MSEKRTYEVQIKRADSAKRIVFGEVYAPLRLDTYGEFMLPDDVEAMAHRFMRLDLSGVVDVQHDNVPRSAYPVESFIAREGDPDFTPGAWVVGVKVDDNLVWSAIEKGELNAFSFQAMVKAREYTVEYEVVRDEAGATEESEGHTHLFFVQLDDRGRVVKGMTDEVDGHRHEIRRGSVTEAASGHTHRYFV